MSNDEDRLVEQPAITQLKGLGWEYIEVQKHSGELGPESERTSFKEVVLQTRLKKAIKRINIRFTSPYITTITTNIIKQCR